MGSQGSTSARALTRAPRRGLVAGMLTLALAWPRPAQGEPKDPAARAHIERGQTALSRDDYDAAIEWYTKALAIEREPKVLYLLGQAEFLRGRCRESVRYFTQVKTFEVGPAVTDAMRPYLAECAERLADEPEPVPEPAPAPDPTPAAEGETTASSSSDPQGSSDDGSGPARRWYQDPLGDVLVAVGLVGAATGTSLLLVARQRRTGATDYGQLEGAADGIQTLRIAGGSALGAGAALMVGGFIRWGLVARKTKGPGPDARVGVIYDGSTAGLSLTGRF